MTVSRATDCNARFPVAIMSKTEDIFAMGLFENGSFYYVTGRLISSGDPFLSKVKTDGTGIDSLVTYQDIFRLEDC